MKSLNIFFIILSCSASISCAKTDTVLTPYEETLKLSDYTLRGFHSVLYYPNGTSLHYPGYIIGIEKSPQRIIGGPKYIKDANLIKNTAYLNEEKSGFTDTKHIIHSFSKVNPKAIYISHILKNNFNIIDNSGETPYVNNTHCFVYNSYIAKALINKHFDLTTISDWHSCSISNPVNEAADAMPSSFYKNGTSGLTALQENLSQDIKSGAYTHILLIVMGWNTSQSEAIRNFNDITGNIMAASLEQSSDVKLNLANHRNKVLITRERAIRPEKKNPGTFRPLVIGVTWPSYWSTKKSNVLSYPNKANDADALGLTWLNKIINETIPESMSKAGEKLPVIAIGHSFGARAITRALFSNPLIKNEQAVSSPVDLAVALEGAMSINRFLPRMSQEGAPYRDYEKLKDTKIVLTASKYDSAVHFSFWSDTAGSDKSYQKACTEIAYSNTFHCMTASDKSATDGNVMSSNRFSICNRGDTSSNCTNPLEKTSMIDYIDTSDGITQYNSYDTGGDAHNDIYRLPMGRLLWRLIQGYAMTFNQPEI